MRYFLDSRVDSSLCTGCTENYIRINIYITIFRLYILCIYLIIAHRYFLDTRVYTSLYTGCTENYVWITIFYFYTLCVYLNRYFLLDAFGMV